MSMIGMGGEPEGARLAASDSYSTVGPTHAIRPAASTATIPSR